MLPFQEQKTQGRGGKEKPNRECKALFTEIKIEEIDMDIANAREICSLLEINHVAST